MDFEQTEGKILNSPVVTPRHSSAHGDRCRFVLKPHGKETCNCTHQIVGPSVGFFLKSFCFSLLVERPFATDAFLQGFLSVCVCECQWHGLHFLSSPPSSFLISLVSSGCPFLFLCCQVKTEISVESKHQTLQGLAFPLQPEAQQAIQLLKQKKINYIQLVRTEPPL